MLAYGTAVHCAQQQQLCGDVSVYFQDLELWIAKERLQDGYNLITRAGRTVQELKVTTDVPLDVMKSAVQTVLRRLA